MYVKYFLFPALAISLLIAAMTPTQAVARQQEESPEALALRLQDRYNSLTSLTFSFTQATRTETRERTGQGDAVFYRFAPPAEEGTDAGRPEKQSVMRWNYTEPDPQIIISDGETLSIYTEKDRQLIRTPARELESDITYAFFAGTRDLLDDFAAKRPDESYTYAADRKLRALLLVPRQPHNQIRDVQVWFDAGYLIHHLRIRDHFDSVTELQFDDIRADSLPAGDRKTLEEIVSFAVPPGTEIISR